MSGPAPAVAFVRSAVRRDVQDLAPGSLVLAAVSGGQDSLALAAGLAFEGPRHGLQIGAVVVDHQLQEDSVAVAAEVAATLDGLGFAMVEVVLVSVGQAGGPEAAARQARYQALDDVATRLQAECVLLGHTLDDQAETVLLGLARGSGARSLAGMPSRRGRFRRPLLRVKRSTTAAACAAAGLSPWADPHNDDPAYSRVRVRRQVMPILEENLGPGVVESLARTAALLRDDDDALEEWASLVLADASREGSTASLDCEVLLSAPLAVRRRALRRAALTAGVSGGSLRSEHLASMDALLVDWHGQGPIHLPGRVHAWRDCGRLKLAREGSMDRGDRSAAEARE